MSRIAAVKLTRVMGCGVCGRSAANTVWASVVSLSV
jgi:hypothetical protein